MSREKPNPEGSSKSSADGRQLASGFLDLMMSQLASRVFSFGLNLFIARKLTPDEFGLAAIQFQLLTSSILFISREGFRRGCLRGETSEGKNEPGGDGRAWASLERTMRVAWLCVPLGILITLASCGSVFLWQSLSLSDPYAHAILLLGLSAVLELGSEPLYILAQSLMLIRLRASLEALASLVRCIVTLALVVAGVGREGGVLFGMAEVGYGGTLFLGYWVYFLTLDQPTLGPLPSEQGETRKSSPQEQTPLLAQGPSVQQRLPLFPFLWRNKAAQVRQEGKGSRDKHRSRGSGKGGEGVLDWGLLRLCGAFGLQSLVKLVLGKGDEFVIVMLQSRFNQGVYGLVSKLGSLVVRTVLQPFEESAFLLFTKTAPPVSQQERARDGSGATPLEEERRRKASAGHLLLLSLKLVNLLGLIFVVFGPSYSRLLLLILYGPTWTATEAPSALAAYCLYIMALALNGTTEAFVHAVMSETQLAASNAWLTLFSLLHMLLSVVLVQAFSAPGLILANCLNMAMRIAFCLVYISAYFKGARAFGLRSSMPHWNVCLALLASAAATHISCWVASATPTLEGVEGSIHHSLTGRIILLVPNIMHVAIGITCLGGVLLALYICEQPFIHNVVALLPGRPAEGHAKEE